jgi:hypothetical protein
MELLHRWKGNRVVHVFEDWAPQKDFIKINATNFWNCSFETVKPVFSFSLNSWEVGLDLDLFVGVHFTKEKKKGTCTCILYAYVVDANEK